MSPAGCGCVATLRQVYVTKRPEGMCAELTIETEITFCTLHRAAGAMRDALMLATSWADHYGMPHTTPWIESGLAALALAQATEGR